MWDRIIQQCILQVMEPICEAHFSNRSYGFRPNRSAEHALADASVRVNKQNLTYVVDVDIKGFFDEVNHVKLMRQFGFIVAPLYMHEGWEEGYRELFERLYNALKDLSIPNLTFELIQHRFTKPAKKVIQERYPSTKLEMDEEKRKYKWGRYGIGKYVYKKDDAEVLEETIRGYIHEFFPDAEIQYFT
ncbi:hypothetical protein B2J90_21340 [Bacillus tropicus]|nr:hypothetical protein B2J90_21340 [Bacillus cereus]